jgi:SAM-dependent methyltransferase
MCGKSYGDGSLIIKTTEGWKLSMEMSPEIRAKLDNDIATYNNLNITGEFPINVSDMRLFADWLHPAGSPMNDSYFVQDLWGAQKVFEAQPQKHYDIGSMVSGFIAHLLSFKMPTVLIDVRPLETFGTKYLTFVRSDATNLTQIEDNSIESLSALCSLEHFGLGRYGDLIDPDAHLKAFESIQRVMKPGGNVYISLPVAKSNRLQFNAHRIYKPHYIVDKFNRCDLLEFSLCTDEGLASCVPLNYEFKDCRYLYGLFHFKKQPTGAQIT